MDTDTAEQAATGNSEAEKQNQSTEEWGPLNQFAQMIIDADCGSDELKDAYQTAFPKTLTQEERRGMWTMLLDNVSEATDKRPLPTLIEVQNFIDKANFGRPIDSKAKTKVCVWAEVGPEHWFDPPSLIGQEPKVVEEERTDFLNSKTDKELKQIFRDLSWKCDKWQKKSVTNRNRRWLKRDILEIKKLVKAHSDTDKDHGALQHLVPKN